MRKTLSGKSLYVCKNRKTDIIFGSTNFKTLSENTGITVYILRRVFLHDMGRMYNDINYEIWKLDLQDIIMGKPRGAGFGSM